MTPKVCGIICEYNPFHLGHLYHLEQARKNTGADYVIAVMSGPFTQRGEPALFSPVDRARMALACGVDAVLELPAAFAVREAEAFAAGGVSILNTLGCVTHLCFGAENPDDAIFSKASVLLNSRDNMLEEAFIKEYEKGSSYPKAIGQALTEVLQPDDPEFFSKPNNLLALSYYEALAKYKSKIQPVPIQRLGNYHGKVEGEFAGASSLREALLSGDDDYLLRNMPAPAAEIACEAIRNGNLCRPDALSLPLLFRLREMTSVQAANLPFIAEGLENKLLSCARKATSRDELLTLLKSKRYSATRLSRLCCHAMLGTTKELLDMHPAPEYARLLGFRKSARTLLALMREGTLSLPGCDAQECTSPLLKIDEKAYDLWALGAGRSVGMIYTEKMVVTE